MEKGQENKMRTNKEKADRFFIEDIISRDNKRLSMSWDYDTDEKNVDERFAVLLYVPWLEDSEHDHVYFEDEEIINLRNWINRYLKMKGRE